MSLKLRDLIRKVRACKTAAEERAVIAKESAMIRTAIREEQAHFRHRNVAKLLYMHMLGYPTHFGQLECMKLTASPHFPEKRIGYLGLMLLLSEDADVLMLATNALKNDLASDNKFVAGLALCAIGNLATSDMSRDLAPEVDKHLKSNLAYLRKKASLAMSRCLAKCPDMVEDFVERAATLLRDKSHGVLVTVVQLLTQMLLIDFDNAQSEGEDPWSTSCRVALLNLVPTFVKMLRNLQSSSGYDDAVSTGNDPFLQVQLLTLLRLLGINNSQACEEMNDVLAQVATANTSETAKNAGNAILYECVQTIMATKSEDGLRVLAVNILGRFLLNRDNNIRYVALNTLGRCMVEQQQFDNGTNSAMSALQRHRQTIVECLKDPDISIRQRSLELIYHLVNKQNVENLTAELLNYLVLCPREHQRDISSRIVQVVDQHSPSDQWRVDTLITTLTIAGREATKQVQSITCVYISRASREVQSFATHKLMKAIRDDDGTQEGLLSVGVWCVGEYGDLLLEPCTYTPSSNESGNTNPITIDALDGSAIVDTLEKVISKRCPEQVLQRALTAFCKLTQRLSNDSIALSKIDKILQKHHISHSLELQLRACEYTALVQASKGIKPAKIAKPVVKEENSTEDLLFGSGSEDFSTTDDAGPVSDKVKAAAKEALNRMPVIDIKLIQKRLASSGDSFSDNGMGSNNAKPAATKTKGEVDLLDLEDIFGGGGGAPATNGSAADTKTAPINGDLFGESTPAATSAKSDPDAGKSDLDLLSDIFATQATTSSPASAAAPFDMFATPAVSAPAPPAAVNPLDLFGTPSIQSSAPVPAVASTSATFDLFGSSSSQPVSNGINNMQQPQAATPIQSSPFDNDLFGSSSVTSAPAPAQNNDVTVPGLSFNGLVVEFKCTKPDTYNAQKSTLIAHFKNTSGAPLYGMNLQVAVPKYVTMELEPPSSTTIPNSATASVTQKVTVTNSMIGTKNLMLKLKVSFTLNGNKLEHMATCSGFPAGEY